jgi:uncharacterized protein
MTEVAQQDRDRMEAAVFRRLLGHLRLRQDAANVELMGLAGFCRNCLADWLAEESGGTLSRDEARTCVYGEPYAAFKARQPEATPDQLARMDASLGENDRVRAAASRALDVQLDATFPASDPPSITSPH